MVVFVNANILGNYIMSFNIAGIGEVLWDIFENNKRFGGAVANVAFHASQLGAHGYIVGAVGDDELGTEGLEYLKEHGLDMAGLSKVDGFPTGTVNVMLDENKVPTYEIVEGVAWENLPWRDNFPEIAGKLDAVCYGSLAQRGELTRKTIRTFLDSVKPDCLKVCDVNLRVNGYCDDTIIASLEMADVLKLSDEELKIVAGIAGLDTAGSDDTIINDFIKKYSLKAVLYTLGKDGAKIFIDGFSYSFKPEPIKPISTVGAGDSFTARAVVGLLNNESPARIIEKACEYAAYVCMQEGAMPKLPDSIKAKVL